MNPLTAVQLPRELLQQASTPERAGEGGGGRLHERSWATALVLVAFCAAVAFALPV